MIRMYFIEQGAHKTKTSPQSERLSACAAAAAAAACCQPGCRGGLEGAALFPRGRLVRCENDPSFLLRPRGYLRGWSNSVNLPLPGIPPHGNRLLSLPPSPRARCAAPAGPRLLAAGGKTAARPSARLDHRRDGVSPAACPRAPPTAV